MRLRQTINLACLCLLLTACTPAQKFLFVSWFHIDQQVRPVMECIKSYESGNYAESSHLSAGSGAYQYIPSTWRHWFGQWRDAVQWVGSDYEYAFQAPPLIQDAVTEYTLTHGGAGNWSPRYGNDPCTIGMGG